MARYRLNNGGGNKVNNINPFDIYTYLEQKGISRNHILGILANIKEESGFIPNAVNPNDVGKESIGLVQWRADRNEKLRKNVPDWETNWKGQIDYLLTEDKTPQYLSKSFENPEQAVEWFGRNVERFGNADEQVKKRISHLNDFSELGFDVAHPTREDIPDKNSNNNTLKFNGITSENPVRLNPDETNIGNFLEDTIKYYRKNPQQLTAKNRKDLNISPKEAPSINSVTSEIDEILQNKTNQYLQKELNDTSSKRSNVGQIANTLNLFNNLSATNSFETDVDTEFVDNPRFTYRDRTGFRRNAIQNAGRNARYGAAMSGRNSEAFNANVLAQTLNAENQVFAEEATREESARNNFNELLFRADTINTSIANNESMTELGARNAVRSARAQAYDGFLRGVIGNLEQDEFMKMNKLGYAFTTAEARRRGLDTRSKELSMADGIYGNR